MKLSESKNVIFADTEEYEQTQAPGLKAVVDAELSKIGLVTYQVGSAFKPTAGMYSGDLDLQIELQDIINHFQAEPRDKKDSPASANKRALSDYLQSRGYQTVQKGVNVFVRVPYKNKFYQVDLECIFNAKKVSRYHQHDIPAGSVYKGVGKQLMLAMLAKSKGFVYSAWEGLFVRTPENKKGQLVADEWDDIAKNLIGKKPNGQMATGRDLDSVEAIVSALPEEQGQALLARAKADANWAERAPKTESIQEGSRLWFRNILNKL